MYLLRGGGRLHSKTSPHSAQKCPRHSSKRPEGSYSLLKSSQSAKQSWMPRRLTASLLRTIASQETDLESQFVPGHPYRERKRRGDCPTSSSSSRAEPRFEPRTSPRDPLQPVQVKAGAERSRPYFCAVLHVPLCLDYARALPLPPVDARFLKPCFPLSSVAGGVRRPGCTERASVRASP